MSAEEIYLANLRLIERIAAFVARRNQFAPDEAAEFVQEVRVRLLEDDYAIIRKFEGRSSFSTYLTTVIGRLHHQWRVEQWGKWRPSAEAKRLGDPAIALERLVTRDGLTLDEALNVLTTRSGGPARKELEALAGRLPLRTPRPVMLSTAEPPDSTPVLPEAADAVEAPERARAAKQAAAAMDAAVLELPGEDRLLLQLRFWEAMRVSDIAKVMSVDQKKLYKRLDKLLLHIRRALENAGVDRLTAATLLSHGEDGLRLHAIAAGESPSFRPSHLAEGETAPREGGLS
jgi:RNA polymerase sigma factor (sigma-70 family)